MRIITRFRLIWRLLHQWDRTNDLLQRLAEAAERLAPKVPEPEKYEVVIDEVEEPKEKDESEGLNEYAEAGKTFARD